MDHRQYNDRAGPRAGPRCTADIGETYSVLPKTELSGSISSCRLLRWTLCITGRWAALVRGRTEMARGKGANDFAVAFTRPAARRVGALQIDDAITFLRGLAAANSAGCFTMRAFPTHYHDAAPVGISAVVVIPGDSNRFFNIKHCRCDGPFGHRQPSM